MYDVAQEMGCRCTSHRPGPIYTKGLHTGRAEERGRKIKKRVSGMGGGCQSNLCVSKPLRIKDTETNMSMGLKQQKKNKMGHPQLFFRFYYRGIFDL